MNYLYYILSISFICIITACAAKDLPTSINIDDQNLLLLCSHQTSEAELQAIAIQIEAIHNMQLDYSQSVFDDTGQLRELSLILYYDNQQIAATTAQLLNLQYRYYGIELTREGDLITGLKAGVFE